MSRDVKDMTREELEAEVLRLRNLARDEALRHAREIEACRAVFERKPPESEKGMGR